MNDGKAGSWKATHRPCGGHSGEKVKYNGWLRERERDRQGGTDYNNEIGVKVHLLELHRNIKKGVVSLEKNR